ncbi:MAG: hypothetical protein N3A38_11230, partial [Planctomycetota bacterium]|nr:hypothetical protein [Planctomycetota bacterium]
MDGRDAGGGRISPAGSGEGEGRGMSGVPGPVRASGGHVGPPRLPIKAEALIPHRPPMLLIEALVRCEGGSALVAAAIPAGHPAAPDGRISEAAMVE